MPNNFKDKLTKQKIIRYREETGVYEVRKQIDGVSYFGSSKNRDEAVRRFIQDIRNGGKPTRGKPAPVAIIEEVQRPLPLFSDIAAEWLEYKKGKVILHTWNDYNSRFERFVPEELKNRRITDIRTNDIDKAIKLAATPRIYEELRSFYNQIFKYAIASGLINHNPVTLIPFKRAERKNRAAMTEEQIKAFFRRIKEPKFDKIRNCAYILYFFGLRPCELDEEAHFENGFLICRNRKRKGGKIEYKKITIPEQAQEFIDFDKPLTLPLCYTKFLKYMKGALGDGLTPYNTRHTFASTCAEYVKEEIVELWMGDAPERLVGKTYIHYSDNYMKEQMKNVHFIIE